MDYVYLVMVKDKTTESSIPCFSFLKEEEAKVYCQNINNQESDKNMERYYIKIPVYNDI